jgi:hypothetical protein
MLSLDGLCQTAKGVSIITVLGGPCKGQKMINWMLLSSQSMSTAQIECIFCKIASLYYIATIAKGSLDF